MKNRALKELVLDKADIEEANFRATYLIKADLHGANFERVNLRKTRLQGSNLAGALNFSINSYLSERAL